MKVGVISDTHNVLREEVIHQLQGCDYIIHAGDVCKEELIHELNQIAKTFVVCGNNDKIEGLPHELEIELNNFLIYVVHDKDDIKDTLDGVNIVIYGHSHQYSYEEKEGMIYLNPGGCGRRRFSLPLTMAIMTLEDNEAIVQKIEL